MGPVDHDPNKFDTDSHGGLVPKDQGSKRASKEVIIAVFGGVASVEKQPDEVDVHIRDYDFDGASDAETHIDEDGEEYVFACACCS